MALKHVVLGMFIATFLTTLHASGIAQLSYRLAGADVVSSYTGIETTSSGGYGVLVGGNIEFKNKISLDLLTGYSVDFLDQSGSGKSLVQIPFQATVKYDIQVMHLGLGVNATIAGIGTKFEYLSTQEPIAGSYSWHVIAEFPLRQDFQRYVGLKRVHTFLNSVGESQNILETAFYLGFAF